VGEELSRRVGVGRLGVGASDVDPGVVVGAADGDPALGLDVDGGGRVELAGPRAVAGLPHREELGEDAAMERGQRLSDVEERMRERAGDLPLLHVVGAREDVAAVSLEPVVVIGGDPEAEDVHGLMLTREPGGQLLGDEHIGQIGELEHAGDGVVVGDRHEVHAPPLGELVDLLGWGGALGERERPLDAELGHLGRRGVAVQIHLDGIAGGARARQGSVRIFQARTVLLGSGLRPLAVRASRDLLLVFVHGHRFARKSGD
jgi:hypothetical protein